MADGPLKTPVSSGGRDSDDRFERRSVQVLCGSGSGSGSGKTGGL